MLSNDIIYVVIKSMYDLEKVKFMARSSSRKRKNYVKFKWTKELIIFLSVLFIAILLTIACVVPTSKEKFMDSWNEATTASSATALDEDNVYKQIKYKDLLKKKNSSEPLFVLYGSTKDNQTALSIQSINQKAKDFDIDRIYILNADFALDADQNSSSDKQMLKERKESLGVEKLDAYCQLWVYQDGKLVFNTQDVIDDKDNTDATFSKALSKCFSTYSPKSKSLN